MLSRNYCNVAFVAQPFTSLSFEMKEQVTVLKPIAPLYYMSPKPVTYSDIYNLAIYNFFHALPM
jgi:hypothetical protein